MLPVDEYGLDAERMTIFYIIAAVIIVVPV
jgi:hypothetical protein